MSTPLTIEVHATPNPNARKFVISGVQFEKSTNYSRADAAAEFPVAHALFELAGVYNVFTAQNFVTVNKRPEISWDVLEEQVRRVLAEHFGDGGNNHAV